MRKTNLVKQISGSLVIISIGLALFLCGLAFGIGAGWQIVNENNKFFPIGWNPYHNMGVTYFIISFCFLVLLIFISKQKSFVSRFVALIPILILFLQCRILVISNLGKLPEWVTEYSGWFKLILYMDYFFLSITTALLILQLYSIWLCKYPLE